MSPAPAPPPPAPALPRSLGLLALRNCIAALVDGESHVPYNTSRLTQLMQRAFAHSGRSRAVLAVTCRLDAAHAQETLQSLRFGEDAARIVTAAGAAGGVQQAAAGALSALNAQLATLTEVISRARADRPSPARLLPCSLIQLLSPQLY